MFDPWMFHRWVRPPAGPQGYCRGGAATKIWFNVILKGLFVFSKYLNILKMNSIAMNPRYYFKGKKQSMIPNEFSH